MKQLTEKEIISKDLDKASDVLRSATGDHVKAKLELQHLKTQFVNETNPVKKERMKPQLIAATKKEKELKSILDKAELAFQQALNNETGDPDDLALIDCVQSKN